MARLSATTMAISALLLVLAVSSAFAQPCIECRDCKTNNCQRVCQKTCPRPVPKPPVVNGDACRRRGAEFGRTAARDACQSTTKYCSGGQTPKVMAARFGIGPVSRPQCANIAYGQCQKTATTSTTSPCGIFFSRPYKRCTVAQFMKFYNGEVDEMCGRMAATISN